MNEKINQHYVPQCYLRRFGHGKNKKNMNIYYYKKIEAQVEKEKIKFLVSENYFYDLKFLEIENNQLLEDKMGELETILIRELRKIDENIEMKKEIIITDDIKVEMCTQIAIQYFRTRKVRECYKEKYKNFCNIFKIDDKELSKSLQISDIIGEDLNEFRRGLLYHIWTIGFISGDGILYTSDNPVSYASTSYEDLKELIINYPISPKYSILIWNRDKKNEYIDLDGKSIEISREFRKKLNILILKKAHEYIFASNQYFNDIKKQELRTAAN